MATFIGHAHETEIPFPCTGHHCADGIPFPQHYWNKTGTNVNTEADGQARRCGNLSMAHELYVGVASGDALTRADGDGWPPPSV